MTQEEHQQAARKSAVWNFNPVEGVKRIVAVGSGKGGVGKSTVTVGLAHALIRAGKRVGILDADIYGPSIPRMLGLRDAGQPEINEGRMVPPVAHGIPCMSMQFITGDEAAVLRGPMITKTLTQLLRMTKWDTPRSSSEAVAPLDILLVDLPPGTGDVQLSLCQAAPLDGAILVTTPQAVAVDDARKAASMFQKVRVKLLGVVENMSGGVFGSGGGEALALECGAPLLGALPLDSALCAAMDAGQPSPAQPQWDIIAREAISRLR